MTRTIVLVHGLRTSSTMWDPARTHLEAAGHSVWAPDLPGHGRRASEEFTAHSAVATVRDAVATAAAAGTGPVDLVGMSLGGMVAVHAAARHTERLRMLVAANCSTQPSRVTARLYGWGIEALHRLPGRPARSGGPVLERLLGRDGAAAYVRGGTAGAATVRAALAVVAGWDLRSDLTVLDVPVVLLSNRMDQLRFHERSFARALRAPSRLEVLPHGTHLSPVADPLRWTRDLLRVLG